LDNKKSVCDLKMYSNTDCSLATLLQRACHGQNTAECHLKNIKS